VKLKSAIIWWKKTIFTEDNDWKSNDKYTFEYVANGMSERSHSLQCVGGHLAMKNVGI
jgi:hypothetical protein